MKKLLLALALLFIPASASAQCSGVFGANTACGTVAGGLPGQISFSSIIGIPSSTDLYVDHTSAGVDVGLCPITAPCHTLQYAGYLIQSGQVRFPSGGGFPIIHSDCNFTESPLFRGTGYSQTGAFFIQATSSPCVWNTAGISFSNEAIGLLDGFTFRTTGAGLNVLSISKYGTAVAVINEVWSSAVGGAFVKIETGGQFISDAGTHQIGDGTSNSFTNFVLNNGGLWSSPGAQAFSVSGAQTFTAWYAGNGSGAYSSFGGAQTYSGSGSGGSSTGLRFAITNGATIDSNTAATTFPGATAGTGLAWTPYTPTATATIGTPTTAPATGQYIQNGKSVTVQASVTVTTVGTAAGAMKITVPSGLTASTTANYVGSCFESAITTKSGAGAIQTSAPTFIYTTDASGTTWWANGKVVDCVVTYQIP